MARFLTLVSVLFLLFSCGQVGTISGGPKDEIAPQITSSNLKDKQLNFSGNTIELTFDEYIELNKASEQIVLVPADSKLQTRLIKKTVSIFLEDSLQKNTTYTLYLNNAVKDVNEGNDSLMKFTFSTGPEIDTMSLHFRLYDAFSKEWLPKVTLGLYINFDDDKPRYFAQSLPNGCVHLESLFPGKYFVKAFADKNQDLHIQESEMQGYFWDAISLNEHQNDTLILPLSLPRQVDKVKNARLIPPGLIGLHVPMEKDRSLVQLNGNILGINDLVDQGEDSLLIAIGGIRDLDLKVVLDNDTIELRNTEKQQNKKIVIQSTDRENLQDRFFFTCTDFIQWLDTSLIKMINLEDSSQVAFEADFLANNFEIRPKKTIKNVKISFLEGAIIGRTSNKNYAFQKELQLKQERDFGDLTIQFNELLSAGIIQIIQKNQVVRQQVFSDAKKVTLSNLLPGEYTLKLMLDLNKNGKWDPVDPKLKTNSEPILLFNDVVKIRANWEIETSLNVNP